jgi:hypothetical protein
MIVPNSPPSAQRSVILPVTAQRRADTTAGDLEAAKATAADSADAKTTKLATRVEEWATLRGTAPRVRSAIRVVTMATSPATVPAGILQESGLATGAIRRITCRRTAQKLDVRMHRTRGLFLLQGHTHIC